MKKKIAIITGATGGIGQEFVKQILKEEVEEIWAVARNEKKLAELQERYGRVLVPVPLDLSEEAQIKEFGEVLAKKKPQIQYLINNAGLAKMASYQEFSLEEISRMVEVNCKAPVLLCQLCIPYMTTGSRILNISSASAFQPNPYINLYAASKAFERSYSRALNVELKGTGITVTAVCPGWVDTELLEKERNGKKIKFPGMVTPDRVVAQAIKDARKGRDMSVCSFYVKCQHAYVKLLPQKWVMKIWVKGISKYLPHDR